MTPEQLWNAAEEDLLEAQDRSRKRRATANADRRLGATRFQIGDRVLLWDAVRAEIREDKFSARRAGPVPFDIEARISGCLWKLIREGP